MYECEILFILLPQVKKFFEKCQPILLNSIHMFKFQS